MRELEKGDMGVLDWFDLIGHQGIYGYGYCVLYKGYQVYEAGQAIKFSRAIIKYLELDFRAMREVAKVIAAPGVSIFGKTFIVAGSATAKVLSGVFGVAGIGFGIWDVINGVKDINGSEVADNLRKAADEMD